MEIPETIKKEFNYFLYQQNREEPLNYKVSKKVIWEHHCYKCKGEHYLEHNLPSGMTLHNYRAHIFRSWVKFDSCPICHAPCDSMGVVK